MHNPAGGGRCHQGARIYSAALFNWVLPVKETSMGMAELRGSSRALHCDMMISATLWLILQVLWVLNIRKCNRMVYSWDMLKLENSQCYKPNVFITFHRTLFIYFFNEILWERTDWRKLSLAAEKATGLGCLTVMQLWHWSANKCDLWWSVMWGSVGGCDLLREERD